ncbi:MULTISPECIES: hypothetical protein [unclassified Pseudomonas]|uniref:hypothetical protein n=1 Tax=unclassified Pseudomonas TaxID=196821 RepID=UPI0021C9ACFD|nr:MULTISPECIES: hypothetical protein [unclassified Pseudomonas]MCU1734774.1 hypothetical protein [Pseudomonas sp. 20P_3.2_Bac4]MCU1745335.1 hypothetical protein [Pseudomonas sp. 20P_3.2_Bac5]
MQVIKKISASSLYMGALLLLLAIAGVLPTHADVRSNGTLELYKKGPQDGVPGNLSCSIELVTGEHNFHDSEACENDQIYYFKLLNAPSATVISFHDTPDCNDKTDQNFYFYLKTVKNNLTFENPLKLDIAATTPVGTIVAGSGGVRMEKKLVAGQIDGKLSCVTIKRSAVPN